MDGELNKVKKFLSSGIDPNQTDSSGYAPLVSSLYVQFWDCGWTQVNSGCIVDLNCLVHFFGKTAQQEKICRLLVHLRVL